MPFTDYQIASVCYAANRALQELLGGEQVSSPWTVCTPAVVQTAVDGVVVAKGGAGPEELHESWCEAKWAAGWRWGPVKDTAMREHPCLVPYDQLPPTQRVKDVLFRAIVTTLVNPFPDEDPAAGTAKDPAGLVTGAVRQVGDIDDAGLLLYGVERVIRKSWNDFAGWAGMSRDQAAAAVTTLQTLLTDQHLTNAIEDAANSCTPPDAEPVPLEAFVHATPGPSVTVNLTIGGPDPDPADGLRAALQQQAPSPAARRFFTETATAHQQDPAPAKLGEDVHYVSYGTPGGEHPQACRPAKITELCPDDEHGNAQASLVVFNPAGLYLDREVMHHEGIPVQWGGMCAGRDYPGGSWHQVQS